MGSRVNISAYSILLNKTFPFVVAVFAFVIDFKVVSK